MNTSLSWINALQDKQYVYTTCYEHKITLQPGPDNYQ